MEQIVSQGKEPLAGAWAGLVLCYLLVSPLILLPTVLKEVFLILAMIGGAKIVKNWN